MPVVTVAAAPHPAIGELMRGVADAVAGALDLSDGDVIVLHTPTGASASSGAAAAASESAWHIVSISGSDRGRENMEAALQAAETAVSSWCARSGADCEGVWTQWLTRLPV